MKDLTEIQALLICHMLGISDSELSELDRLPKINGKISFNTLVHFVNSVKSVELTERFVVSIDFDLGQPKATQV